MHASETRARQLSAPQVIPLLATLKIEGLKSMPLGLLSDGYQDFTAQWYDRTGQALLIALAVTAFGQRFSFFATAYCLPPAMRFAYRCFGMVHTQVRSITVCTARHSTAELGHARRST